MRDLVQERKIINHYGIVHVTLKGINPLLMNQYRPKEFGVEKTTLKKKVYDPVIDAAKSAYIDEIDGKKQLYVPEKCVRTMIVQSCSGKKIKNPNGGRDIAARGIIAGSLRIVPDKIPLGTDQYEIDIQKVTVVKAAVDRARARVPNWRLKFDLIYDTDYIKDPSVFLEILDEAGFRMGLLDFRPQHMGSNGTFTVEHFEVED